MDKELIRKTILAKRQELTAKYVKSASAAIREIFLQEFSFLNVFLFYFPINGEVDTLPLVDYLHNEGKKIYLPCVVKKKIIFKRFDGLEKLSLGKFQIPEPTGYILDEPADVVVLPCIAFDTKCNRVGYGEGYYDKYLALAQVGNIVGFAYDFQIVENIITEDFDKPADIVITERRVIRRKKWMCHY